MTPNASGSGRHQASVNVRQEVLAWIDQDPDPVTRAQLENLLRTSGEDPDETDPELADAFSGSLEFGTAGLRGKMGAGPNRMNRAVVIRTAAGLASFLTRARGDAQPRIVIGYDARHNSQTFAADTAAVMQAAGVETLLLPSALPTPILAFAVRHLNADAGVMVTASHNPAEDNGYKVYLGGQTVSDAGQGTQIVAPYDQEISDCIVAAPGASSVPRAEDGWDVLPETIVGEYKEAVGRLATAPDDPTTPRDLRIVYTPLHGVGGQVVTEVLADAGYLEVFPVPLQADPDPDFPTVGFPNPEEAGAIDLALSRAQEHSADLVIANDPDADRCAIAVRDPRRDHTGPDQGQGHPAADWRMLHGDEVGALLGQAIGENAARLRIAPGALWMANSIVSSRLLGRIASGFGFSHATTLTGFKWIARTEAMIFGYEEAIGFCVDPDVVRDKDGISAALLLAQLADRLKAEGRTIIDALDDLARAHGLFLTDQLSLRFTDLSQIPRTMELLRTNPPTELLGSPLVRVADLNDGFEGLPPTDGLLFLAADDTRVIVRPSGTEPKVKCYLEVVSEVAPEASFEDLSEVREAARSKLGNLKDEMSRALGAGG